MQDSGNTAYLILSLMLFVLRIHFEDVQACLTIQRAVQIIVVTPDSDDNISQEEEEEKGGDYKLWPAGKCHGSLQSLSKPVKCHSCVTGMYEMACEQAMQCTTASSKKHPTTWSC